MKRTISTLLLLALISHHAAVANDEKYMEAMQKSIKTIYEATDIQEYQHSVNAFERIAAVEKNKWEPLYYVAFGNVMMANLEPDNVKKDGLLDRAMEAITEVKKIKPDESEIIALEGFVYMLRIGVDPQSRGMIFAPQAVSTLNQALSLNPDNPRALALLAQMEFGTAQFFGSSTAEACVTNAKAAGKFETYRSENVLAPVWGKRMVEGMKEKCG